MVAHLIGAACALVHSAAGALPLAMNHDANDGVPSLLCTAAGIACTLPLAHVIETMRPLPIEPFAGAPRCVLGVAMIRGEALPVVDLGEVLGAKQTQITRFVTLNLGARRAALAVEAVVGVRVVRHALLSALPPLLDSANVEAVSAIGRLDSQLMRALSAMHLLPHATPEVGEGMRP
jgi:purine-binding chemotaxis protein CheW